MSSVAERPVSGAAADGRERRGAVDFWRGFVLCTIFVNHVPGNVFERFTYRNLGLSDSAEAFVFISGLSLAMAYGGRFVSGGRMAVLGRLLRRAAVLYGTHVGLSLAAVAIFGLGAASTGVAELMEVHGRGLFLTDPAGSLAGLVTLGHQLGYFNILPNYVLLLAFAPALFWLAHRDLRLMLAVSGSLYLLCRATGINLPTWPEPGAWFFDPFAWQFLMAVGIATGFALRRTSVPRSPVLTTVSWLVVGLALFAVTDGFSLAPGAWDWVRGWADLDKTTLGLGRLVHFLAIAYLVNATGLSAALRRTPLFEPLATIGRHGLAVFALLSLLAAALQVVAAVTGHALPVDAVLVGGSLVLIYAAARRLDRGWHLSGAVLPASPELCGAVGRP